MTVAHIMGIPVEESVLPLVPAGMAIVTAVAIAGRMWLGGLRRWLRHRPQDAIRLIRRQRMLGRSARGPVR